MSIRIFLVTTICLLLLSISVASLLAQPALTWAPQRQVPVHDVRNNQFNDIYPPFLLADSNRTVHAFNDMWLANQKVIEYSTWSLEQGWSTPIDVLLSPEGQARTLGATLDQNGVFHVVFFGGDDQGASIYYSQAHAALADKARGWSPPLKIGTNARTPTSGALIGDGAGVLVTVYSGDADGRGVYSVYSQDAGSTWTAPEPIFLAESDDISPYAIVLSLDSERRLLHATWILTDARGNGLGLYYARLDIETFEWTEAEVLVPDITYEPAIVTHQGEVFVVYHDETPPTRYMRRSSDGGTTWTNPERLFEQVGSNGAPSLVVDSTNTLHMLFGNRIGSPAVHGMWHSMWMGDRWTPPEPVVSGPRLTQASLEQPGFDPSYAHAVVSQGNMLLVTWRTDEGIQPNGIWYSYADLGTPELPVLPLPAPPPSPTPTPTATPTPLPSPTPRPTIAPALTAGERATNAGRDSPNPGLRLLSSIAPVIVLISIVIAVNQHKRHTR